MISAVAGKIRTLGEYQGVCLSCIGARDGLAQVEPKELLRGRGGAHAASRPKQLYRGKFREKSSHHVLGGHKESSI